MTNGPVGPLWLASRSPRRRDLLVWAGFEVDVHPSHADETRYATDDPVTHARRLAARKAETGPENRAVVAADTVVHLDDRTLDIPRDRQEAIQHITDLGGRWHEVTTGVAVRHGSRAIVFSVTTEVRFRRLRREEIEWYVATGEADDKAGAYGIQGRGGSLVAEIRGSWTNVMGLPLEQTLDAFEQIGLRR